MEDYRNLAQELFLILDRSKQNPPHKDFSASMRGEMAVMRLLVSKASSLTAGDISKLLHMTTSRIAAVLNSLEKKGMILRSADKTDKRRVLVTLTDKGEAFCCRKKQEATDDMAQLLACLGEKDAPELVRLVGRMHELMQSKDEQEE